MTDSRSKQSLPRGTQCERVDWLEGLFNYLCHADPMSLEVPQSAAAFPETPSDGLAQSEGARRSVGADAAAAGDARVADTRGAQPTRHLVM